MSSSAGSTIPSCCQPSEAGSCNFTKPCKLTTEDGQEVECECTCKCNSKVACKDCKCDCKCTPETAIKGPDGKYRCECECSC